MKREARCVYCHCLMVDLMFEQSENIAIIQRVQAAALGHNGIGSKMVLRLFAHVHCANWQS